MERETNIRYKLMAWKSRPDVQHSSRDTDAVSATGLYDQGPNTEEEGRRNGGEKREFNYSNTSFTQSVGSFLEDSWVLEVLSLLLSAAALAAIVALLRRFDEKRQPG